MKRMISAGTNRKLNVWLVPVAHGLESASYSFGNCTSDSKVLRVLNFAIAEGTMDSVVMYVLLYHDSFGYIASLPT